MAREISETREVKAVKSVAFNRRAVSAVKIGDEQLRADVVLSSTEHEEKDRGGVVVDLSELTVETALGELETHLGKAPVLSELTVLDFVHSVVHERAKE